MSDEIDKLQHSERLQQKENRIRRQLQLAKNYGYHKLGSGHERWRYLTEPHRNHKMNIFNCGDSRCAMCGNPRKFFKEKTVQEKRFEQRRLHEEKFDIIEDI